MTLKNMYCRECGHEIVFSYVNPIRSFRIEDEKIKRDDAWEGPGHDNPYFDFFCSNDRAHDIGDDKIMDKWMEEVEYAVKENLLST